MKNGIFFFDFDDTLFSHITKRVSEKTITSLRQLENDGHIIIVATGRGREAIRIIERELGFVPSTVIALNGQIILENGVLVYDNHIDLGSIDRLSDKARQMDIAYGGYYWDGVIANTVNERVERVWTDWGQPLPFICSKLETEYKIYQGQLYITKEEQTFFDGILEEYITNWSHEYLVNLIPRAAGKSQAVRWCIEKYQIPHENTFAFGDGFNDVDMIETVRHGVAMGNSTSEQLKQKAEYITAPSHEEGIYKALAHYKLVSAE